ncbi:MAG: class I SAM-dependent methyltransferase [Methanotrichaceae archaeon]|nr:class I SAM-dependent methyltransferase [Methanotrichaceae archaeon]
MSVALDFLRRKLSGQPSRLLPVIPDGIRLHVGAGQNLIDGYENLDAYDNEQRPEYFQTQVKKFVHAEILDTIYQPESVAEIRCHHVFEHISMLDVDRTLQGWNKILKPGGLIWIEVPDFEGCAKQIVSLRREEDKEIFYRHIFGSQMGPGEFHYNGFTAKRLIKLLEDYGFKIKLAYVIWTRRLPRKPDMCYPSDVPLPDLTVKAIKVGSPKPEVIIAEWTHIAYRRQYPNPAFISQIPGERTRNGT